MPPWYGLMPKPGWAEFTGTYSLSFLVLNYKLKHLTVCLCQFLIYVIAFKEAMQIIWMEQIT